MSRGWARAAPQRASSAGPGTSALPPTAEHDGALELLLAALADQQRTTLALYRLVRGMAGLRARPSGRAKLRRPPDLKTLLALGEPPSVAVGPQLRMATPTDARRDEPAARMPLLQVRCFGRFEVVRDGRPVQRWRRGKAKTLLKYLVVRHQPVPRDVLLDLLWPDIDPQVAVNGLRVALHALRQDLGPCAADGREVGDYVIFDGGNYLLNPEARLWVDAEEFAGHFGAGRQLERQQQPAEAMRRYEQAEAVYRDDYLLEDLYEDWTLVRREELKDQYLLVLTKLADHCIQHGDVEGCIVRCHRILQKDACREDAYQRLIRCYLQLGQRSQARHWYDLCVRTLRQELDAGPSEQTRLLLQ